MLIRWALFLFRRARLVATAVVALVLVGALYGSTVFGHVETNGQDFQDPGSSSATFTEQYLEQFPRSQGQYIVLFSSPTLRVDDSAYATEVNGLAARIGRLPQVTDVTGYYTSQSSAFVSDDRHDTFLSVSAVPAHQDEVYDKLVRLAGTEGGPAYVSLGGSVTIHKQINEQVKRDLKKAELISFPILGVLLLLFFGSAVAALIPLGLGGLSILAALFIMRLLTSVTTISAYAINVVTLLGLGLAIDYSLFMVGRFREELRKRNDVEVALAMTVNHSGRTMLLSGTMVAISLLSLLVFPQTFFRSVGLGGAAVVLTTVALSLTMLPAVLRLLGNRINLLTLIRNREPDIEIPTFRFWYQFSNFIMRHAVPAFAATLLVLLCIAGQFVHAHLSSTDITTIPKTLSSRQVNETLQHKFSSFSSEPVTILLQEPGDPMSHDNLVVLQRYVASLRHIAGVEHVDSLLAGTNPQVLRTDGPLAAGLRVHYVSGNYTTITVRQSYQPQSDAARGLIKHVRDVPLPEFYAAPVGGVSAQLVDLLDSLRAHVPEALLIICSATFVLVFMLTGSVVLPVKAIVLDLLSLCTALGILAWTFQYYHLTSLVPLTALGSVDATSAVLVFAVAFGLSADYEFFLLSRVKEEFDATGDTTHAIAYGVQRTAGIITAAALLFVSVIGLFMTSKVSLLQQIGLGLSAAVIVDATFIRLVLVAATMRILGTVNWWAPRPLRVVYRKFGAKLE